MGLVLFLAGLLPACFVSPSSEHSVLACFSLYLIFVLVDR